MFKFLYWITRFISIVWERLLIVPILKQLSLALDEVIYWLAEPTWPDGIEYLRDSVERGYKKVKIQTLVKQSTTTAAITVLILLLALLLNGWSIGWFDVTKKSLLISALLTFIAAALILPSRVCKTNTTVYAIIISFVVLTIFFIQTDNAALLFLVYEMFLMSSAVILTVSSPNKRSIRSTMYFILWTQAGSMLVLAGFLHAMLLNTSVYFSNWNTLPTTTATLILLGFGVKIPIFPFFFWLTKTHVEAITSFSIFLSGFLVKLALFGMIKIQASLNEVTYLIFLVLSCVSILAATVGFLYQTDYKKVIAYATVQEMGILFLVYLIIGKAAPETLANLLVVHTLLSAALFSAADILYRRFGTRAIHALKGLVATLPKLSVLLVLVVLLFKGLPFTTKFTVEFNLYSAVSLKAPPLLIPILLLLVMLGNLIFSAIHFKILFQNPGDHSQIDCSLKEASILLISIVSLLFLVL